MATFLLYDAGCGTCRAFAQVVVRLVVHGRLHRVPLGAPLASRLLRGVPLTERFRSFHLVTPDGAVHSAGAAVVVLPGLFPAGSLLRLLLRRTRHLRGFVARLYDVLAAHKVRGACGLVPPGCAVQPPPAR